MKQSQSEKLLAYLKDHPEGITPLEALRVIGTMRLAARVYDLRKQGHNITEKDEIVSGGARVARYRLEWIPETWVKA